MLGAVLLLDQLDDGAARIVARRADTDREANGARLLRRLVFEAHASADTMRKFVGDDRSASFHDLCDVPGGWSEPCDAWSPVWSRRVASLTIDDRGDSSAIVADLSIGGSLVLRRAAARHAWRYLDATPKDTTWATHWSSGTTLPAALALVSASDTIVFPVQVRRE